MDRTVYDRMDQLEAEHWWFAARRRIIEAAIRRLVRLRNGASILEAGCGTGGNLAMLRSLGDLDAFEYDQEARRRAEEKSGLAIAGGALPDELPYPGKSYDLIALFDVLEHVEKDSESLHALATRLTPGGRILLTVPAYQWLWSKHDVTHHHFRRYTKATLRDAAREAGMDVEHSFHFNSLLFPLAISVRALKLAIGSQRPDDDMPAPLVNSVLKRVFSAERSLVGRLPMPFGLSLCAVLKPRRDG